MARKKWVQTADYIQEQSLRIPAYKRAIETIMLKASAIQLLEPLKPLADGLRRQCQEINAKTDQMAMVLFARWAPVWIFGMICYLIPSSLPFLNSPHVHNKSNRNSNIPLIEFVISDYLLSDKNTVSGLPSPFDPDEEFTYAKVCQIIVDLLSVLLKKEQQFVQLSNAKNSAGLKRQVLEVQERLEEAETRSEEAREEKEMAERREAELQKQQQVAQQRLRDQGLDEPTIDAVFAPIPSTTGGVWEVVILVCTISVIL